MGVPSESDRRERRSDRTPPEQYVVWGAVHAWSAIQARPSVSVKISWPPGPSIVPALFISGASSVIFLHGPTGVLKRAQPMA